LEGFSPELKLEVTKLISHRRDAKGTERKYLYTKPLRALRLCGEYYYAVIWKEQVESVVGAAFSRETK
jgi:hypothetical protein